MVSSKSSWERIENRNMKKIILFLLTLVTCAAVSGAAADDLKDNSLQIDDSRLEKKEGLKFGLQSEQTKELLMKQLKRGCRTCNSIKRNSWSQKGPTVFCYQRPVKNLLKNSCFSPMLKKTIKFQNKYRPCRKKVVWMTFFQRYSMWCWFSCFFGATAVMSYRDGRRDGLILQLVCLNNLEKDKPDIGGV